MTVNHGVLGSSPCSGAIARGLRKGSLKWCDEDHDKGSGSPEVKQVHSTMTKKSIKICRFEKMNYLCSPKPFLRKREFSSAGSEHLPYKQRVGGSNPSTPTKQRRRLRNQSSFFWSTLYMSNI